MRAQFSALLLLALLGACSGDSTAPQADPAAETARDLERLREDIAKVAALPEAKDDVIEVQHILISFRGSSPRMPPSVTRTREEAEALAADVYGQLRDGGDFTALMEQHSDDKAGSGIYRMSQNREVPADYARNGMAPAFGDVGWRLGVGEIGVAAHDPAKSPFGWHLIKRLK
jgi:parvulin-like peptidyl-prolyl isomerase